MTTLNRRAYLGVTSFAVGAALQTFTAFNTSRGSGRLTAPLGAGGYGGFGAAKARNTGEEILTLPEGFEYNFIGKTGMKMSDFSPDGHKLFVNIQTPGVTLAIWGPWERGTL